MVILIILCKVYISSSLMDNTEWYFSVLDVSLADNLNWLVQSDQIRCNRLNVSSHAYVAFLETFVLGNLPSSLQSLDCACEWSSSLTGRSHKVGDHGFLLEIVV